MNYREEGYPRRSGLRKLPEQRRVRRKLDGVVGAGLPAGDSSQELDPVLEIHLGSKAGRFQQATERLPDGQLPGNDDTPVFLVFPRILIVESDEIPDVEGYEAAFFLDGKGELLAIGFSFSFQILGVNDIKSPLSQRVGQAGVDILVQEQFQFHRSPLRYCRAGCSCT